jgi:hypothetical protein
VSEGSESSGFAIVVSDILHTIPIHPALSKQKSCILFTTYNVKQYRGTDPRTVAGLCVSSRKLPHYGAGNALVKGEERER